MKFSDPAIIWPAPGFPAFLEPRNQHLDVLIAFLNPQEALHDWAQEISLHDRLGNTIIPLLAEEIAQAEPQEIADKAAQFSALPSAAGLNFARIRFRAPLFLPQSSARDMQLFDLSVKGQVERPRSVVFLHRPSSILKIAFASDLHVAHLWNEIAEAADRYAPELAEVLANPQRLLDNFIDEANALAASGDLDLIVLGGDLVDHVHRHPRAKKRDCAAGNIHLLLAMLDRLEVPTLMIPGNHDYRAYPRRPRSSGLDVIGISRQQSESLLRKSGLWDFWPLSLRDLDALQTDDEAGIPALSDYLTHGAPATNYCVSLRGLRLLLASSGCDILARWRNVEPERLGLLVRGLRTALSCPDSEGFSETQLAQITGWLSGSRGAALFFHAPLLATRRGVQSRGHICSLESGPQNSLGRRVLFEKRLQRAGFRCGVSLRNPGALLEKLSSTTGPIAAFSGHVHYPSAAEIDRDTKQARFINPSQAASRSDTITLLTAPALGQLGPLTAHRPGYLLARFEDGALVSLQCCTVNFRG
jgi:predicted phosphodiesterase